MKGSTHMSWGLGLGVQSQMKMSSLLINIIKNCKLSNSTMTIMDEKKTITLHYAIIQVLKHASEYSSINVRNFLL